MRSSFIARWESPRGSLTASCGDVRPVVILSDAPLLAAQLPVNPGRYQHFVVPRAALFSGDIDAHDLAWTGSQLCAANTRLSCIAAIDGRHSFTPLMLGIDDDRHRRAQLLPGRAFWGEETAEE